MRLRGGGSFLRRKCEPVESDRENRMDQRMPPSPVMGLSFLPGKEKIEKHLVTGVTGSVSVANRDM